MSVSRSMHNSGLLNRQAPSGGEVASKRAKRGKPRKCIVCGVDIAFNAKRCHLHAYEHTLVTARVKTRQHHMRHENPEWVAKQWEIAGQMLKVKK